MKARHSLHYSFYLNMDCLRKVPQYANPAQIQKGPMKYIWSDELWTLIWVSNLWIYNTNVSCFAAPKRHIVKGISGYVYFVTSNPNYRWKCANPANFSLTKSVTCVNLSSENTESKKTIEIHIWVIGIAMLLWQQKNRVVRLNTFFRNKLFRWCWFKL